MAFDKFPFAFDAEKFGEFFKMPEMAAMFDANRLPAVDVDALIAAQQKNLSAIVEANKIALAGYQEIYKRQIALFEQAIAQIKDQMAEFQSQPISSEQAAKNLEILKGSMEKAVADAKELTDLAQKANAEAFEVVKARFKEAVAEFNATAGRMDA